MGTVAPFPCLQVVETRSGSGFSWTGQGSEGWEKSSHQQQGCLSLPDFDLLAHQALMKRSLCLMGGKKTTHTPQKARGSYIPPVGQPSSAGKICNFPTPGTRYSHKASNISVRQSGSSSSIGRARLSQPDLLVWHGPTNNLASVALGKKRKRQQLSFLATEINNILCFSQRLT